MASQRITIRPSEHQEQAALIGWWRVQCTALGIPEPLLYAIPNGGARDAITGRNLRDEGVRRGIPDLMLAVPNDLYHGLYIELKTQAGRPSPEQRQMIEMLNTQGFRAVICHGFEEARNEILCYLAISRAKTRSICNDICQLSAQ